MYKSMLRRQVTIAEAEAKHMAWREDLWPGPIPFGFLYRKWRSMVDNMQPGDELWEFSSSNESWANLGGRCGIAVVRDGDVVAHLMTAMN